MEADPGTALTYQMRELLMRNLTRAIQDVVYSNDSTNSNQAPCSIGRERCRSQTGTERCTGG